MCYSPQRPQGSRKTADFYYFCAILTRNRTFSKKVKKLKKTVDKTPSIEYTIIVAGRYGSLAQLGEHLPYKQRVTGSSPVTSTIWPSSSVG